MVPTVFHEPWWLDIVTQRSWMAAEVSEGGRVIGRLPYHIVRQRRGPVITMPPLTHFLGPAIDDGAGSAATRWLKRTTVSRELVRKLPAVVSFWQKFHRGVTDVLPFQAERFTAGVQFTFEVAPAPEEALWRAMRDKHRNMVRKARRLVEVEELADPEEFAHYYVTNLNARGLAKWVDGGLMATLLGAARHHGAGLMLGARNEAGALIAAVFCARDSRASYFTLSTRSVDAGNAPISLLVWEQLRRAAEDGLIFDFDGVSNSSSIRLYAGFGGVTAPRYSVSRNVTSGLVRFIRRHLGLRNNTFGS